MLEGCMPWPEHLATRYRREGYWVDITLNQMLARSIERQPDKIAVVDGKRRVSYRALGESIGKLAVKFAESGLQPRDRVVVQLTNCIEFVVVFFALMRIGVIPVLSLPAHRHQEVSHFITHSGAVAFIIPECIRGFDYRAMADDIAARLPT